MEKYMERVLKNLIGYKETCSNTIAMMLSDDERISRTVSNQSVKFLEEVKAFYGLQ